MAKGVIDVFYLVRACTKNSFVYSDLLKRMLKRRGRVCPAILLYKYSISTFYMGNSLHLYKLKLFSLLLASISVKFHWYLPMQQFKTSILCSPFSPRVAGVSYMKNLLTRNQWRQIYSSLQNAKPAQSDIKRCVLPYSNSRDTIYTNYHHPRHFCPIHV